MTVELVTGFADTPHIDAADDGALNAAIISDSNHVLGTPSPAVMRDSNHLTVPTMQALFLGRYVRVTSAEDVTIASGSQGLKRHDIVGFRYSRDSSTNVETVVLDVIRGTASSTPADPALPSGNILTGASSAFMPLYRVPLDGINVGTPVPLFNVLGPMRELWASANQLPGIKTQISGLQASANQLPGIKTQISGLQNFVTQVGTLAFKLPYASQTIKLVKRSGIVVATGQITMNKILGHLTHEESTVYLPEGWRPTSGSYILGTANNAQLISYGVSKSGRILTTTSGANTEYVFSLTGTWFTE